MEFWFSEFHTPDVKHSIRVNKQLYSKQSDYQRIDIFETPEFGRVLTLDGNVMLTERDEFIYDEMIVHVPMAVHREAKDILVIGAGDGGVVRELTRYDRVERIDLVEMDPQVVEACRAYLPGNACRMDDRRVHIYFENALKFIRQCEEEYDLIIVDSSDPFGPSEGLFTREFYGSCFNALKEDGIMVNQQGSPFYAEDASAMQPARMPTARMAVTASTFLFSFIFYTFFCCCRGGVFRTCLGIIRHPRGKVNISFSLRLTRGFCSATIKTNQEPILLQLILR